jgi:tyrosyl-tRNA synthetase
MYGKVMSLPDTAMPSFFRLVTRWPVAKIGALESGMAEGSMHPREVKMELAREIVDIFHGSQAARIAEEKFVENELKGLLGDANVVLIGGSST